MTLTQQADPKSVHSKRSYNGNKIRYQFTKMIVFMPRVLLHFANEPQKKQTPFNEIQALLKWI